MTCSQCLEVACQLERELNGKRSTRMMIERGTGPIGRQVQDGKIREGGPPVSELLFEDISAQSVALPLGIVGVLDLERRQR